MSQVPNISIDMIGLMHLVLKDEENMLKYRKMSTVLQNAVWRKFVACMCRWLCFKMVLSCYLSEEAYFMEISLHIHSYLC